MVRECANAEKQIEMASVTTKVSNVRAQKNIGKQDQHFFCLHRV